ncbi:MAG TPA: TolC family protein [Bacteroidia bacterium]|nr:TolC family protein [Bacteroidia bacterium]
MKYARITLTWIAAAAIPALLSAQQTDTSSYAFSLQQSVDFALQHNTAYQNVLLDETAATAKVKEVTGIGLPQVNGSFQVQDFLEIPTSMIPGEFFGGPPGSYIPVKFGTKYNATAGVTASQLVFSGPWLVGLQAARLYQDLALKNADRTKIETSCDVTKAYYNALVTTKKKELLDANLDRVKKVMDDTKAFYDNGFVEKIEVDRITVTYNNLVTEVSNAQRLMDLSMVMLKYQMGMDQSAKLTLTDNIENISFTPAETQNGKFDYTKRVEFQLMDMQLRGKELAFRADRMGYFPTVALFGSAQAQAQRTKFDFLDGTSQRWFPVVIVGLQVSVPIFDGFQRHYMIQQDRVGILQAQNDLLFMQRTIDMQQAVAKTTLTNSAATLAQQKANLDLAQEVFDAAKTKYDQGVGSNLEIINAQTALKEAQTNYFDALTSAVIAKVDYDKATGTFNVK